MQDLRAVITGLGVVSPAGNGKEEFFQGLVDARNFVREIDRFDASRYPARSAGMVERLEADAAFSKRLIKKLDRFSHMALIAAGAALADSGTAIENEDGERVGIILGNALGGWGFAETELRDLYQGGVREVSPYQATAWFPAAPQGQISIHYGIKGFAKTIISDIASSHLAIGYAARAIMTGKADLVLAGGAEAPVSPYALLCCNTSGELSTSGSYRPFDRARDGYVIGEGAAILVVEELGRAKARGARIYAEVAGFGHTSDGTDPIHPDPEGEGLRRAIINALGASGARPEDVDYLMPAGVGGMLADASEALATRKVFGGLLENGLAVGVPKALYGNLLGASGALDVVTACLAMDKGIAPAYTGCAEPEAGWSWVKGKARSIRREVSRVMVNSIGRGGVNSSLVLEKPEI